MSQRLLPITASPPHLQGFRELTRAAVTRYTQIGDYPFSNPSKAYLLMAASNSGCFTVHTATEQFLRLKLNLYGCAHIPGRFGLNHGNSQRSYCNEVERPRLGRSQ